MIVLLGYMGSGKTVVGQFVSELLNLEFIDLDREIELSQKQTINELFEKKGAVFFRKLENERLKNILESNKNSILSLGGGTPCYYNNMDLLNDNLNITSFYLDCSIPILVDRLWHQKDNRPLISNMESKELLTEFVGKHLFERRPEYAKANYTIKINQKSIEEISEEIIAHLF